MRSRLRALILSREVPVGSMGQQGAAIWLGRHSSPDRTLSSDRFLWQAQSLRRAITVDLQSVNLGTHNNSRISQSAAMLTVWRPSVCSKKVGTFGFTILSRCVSTQTSGVT